MYVVHSQLTESQRVEHATNASAGGCSQPCASHRDHVLLAVAGVCVSIAASVSVVRSAATSHLPSAVEEVVGVEVEVEGDEEEECRRRRRMKNN